MMNLHTQITLAATLIFVLGLFVAPYSHGGSIYKTTDAQGNVIFTDVPPNDESKSIELINGNSYQPATPAAVPNPDNSSADETLPEDIPAASYNKLTITAPAHDQALRENTGNISVSVALDPALNVADGHRVRVLVDGAVAAEAASATVGLQNIDRGTHTLVAEIVDASDTVLKASSPVIVHLQRYSILNQPAKPKPAGS
jgi:hypothetical protein